MTTLPPETPTIPVPKIFTRRAVVGISSRMSVDTINRIFAAGVRRVTMTPGEYLLGDELFFPPECEIMAEDCVVKTVLRGRRRGHRMANRTIVRGGKWETKWIPDNIPWSGLYGSVFSAGPFFDNAPSAHRFEIHDVEVETDSHASERPEHQKDGGNGIAILGDCSGWLVSDVRSPAVSPWMGGLVLSHWGTRTRADGAFRTIHPSGIIERIAAKRMTNTHTETSPVRLSASDMVLVSHVSAEYAANGMCIYDGDHGWEKAEGHPARVVIVNGLAVKEVWWSGILSGRGFSGEYESCQTTVTGMYMHAVGKRLMLSRGTPPKPKPGEPVTDPDLTPSPGLVFHGSQLY